VSLKHRAAVTKIGVERHRLPPGIPFRRIDQLELGAQGAEVAPDLVREPGGVGGLRDRDRDRNQQHDRQRDRQPERPLMLGALENGETGHDPHLATIAGFSVGTPLSCP
jgi:hypothetical protein